VTTAFTAGGRRDLSAKSRGSLSAWIPQITYEKHTHSKSETSQEPGLGLDL
jgi:hypothetical protein